MHCGFLWLVMLNGIFHKLFHKNVRTIPMTFVLFIFRTRLAGNDSGHDTCITMAAVAHACEWQVQDMFPEAAICANPLPVKFNSTTDDAQIDILKSQ